jgi:Dicarboxylate transport
MTRSRLLFPGLGIMLLTIAGTGFYLYQNLPVLLRQQAIDILHAYGVEDIAYTGLTLLNGEIRVETLTFSGTYENLVYEAKLASAVIHYDWRALLNGGVESLALSKLSLSINSANAVQRTTTTVIKIDQITPQALMAQLPMKSLAIEKWHLDYHPANGTGLSANGHLNVNGQLDLMLDTIFSGRDIAVAMHTNADAVGLDAVISVQENKTTIAHTTVKLRPAEDERWLWQLEGNADHAPALTWLQQLDTQLEFGIAAADTLAVQGESVFTVQIEHGNELIFASTENANNQLLRQIGATVHLRNSIQQLDIPSLVNALNGTLEINAAYIEGQLSATVQPFNMIGQLWTAQLSLPADAQRWLGWNETIPVSLETTGPIGITRNDTGAWSVQSHNASLSLGEKDSRIRLQKLGLETTVTIGEQLDATTQINASLNTRLRKQALPQLEIALTQRGSNEQSTFDLRLADTAESFRTAVNGTLDLHTGAGNFKLDTQISDLAYFSTSTVPLLRHFKLLAEAVEIRSGTARLSSKIKSKDFDMLGWEQQSQASITNMSGSLDEYRFDGLSLTADWSGITRWKTRKPLEISLAKIRPGFAVENIRLRVSLPKATPIAQPQVRIETFTAGLFGGEVCLPDAQFWDFSAPSNKITLRARDWQLGDLVALQPNADIHAQGILEGELPVTIADGRIIIEQGYLRALPPGGFIRYISDEKGRALADSNPELAMAIDLLSDFQYEVLRTDVQLDKAGNLLLGLSLAGSNPAHYEGQAINFNINLEQNLDPLLQSLRLSDNVTKRIEGRMK